MSGVAGKITKADVASSADALQQKAHHVRMMAIRGDLKEVKVAAKGVAEELKVLYYYLLKLEEEGK